MEPDAIKPDMISILSRRVDTEVWRACRDARRACEGLPEPALLGVVAELDGDSGCGLAGICCKVFRRLALLALFGGGNTLNAMPPIFGDG